MKKHKFLLLGVVVLVYALMVLPLFVLNQKSRQDLRSRASTVCSTNSPADISIIIDRSGSMNDTVGSSTKISGARTAANQFIDLLAQNTENHVNLVSYSTTANLDSPLTNNYAFLKSKVSALTASGSTCTECAIKKANADLHSNGRSNMKKVVVLLTDGKANYVDGSSQQANDAAGIANAEQKALAAAVSGHNADGTLFFTIGLGNDVNASFLQTISAQTGGQYYFPPSTDSLAAIYAEISQIIAQGAVSGTVFNDANKNGTLDTNEQKVSSWTVTLTNTSTNQTTTLTTDTNGYFSFTGICNGVYSLKTNLQSGWIQTFPANAAPHSITITNGQAATDQNFGVTQGARCSDSIDNDTNGFTDAADSTCHTDGNPTNASSYDPTKDGEHGGGNTCADSKDNNGNGLIDGADPICHTDGNPGNPTSYDPTRPENSRCSDTVDNDNNGFADTKDSTCHTDGNPTNASSYDPTKDGEHGGGNTCADSKDNNGNGLIDGADPICHTDGNPGNPTSYDPTRPEGSSSLSLDLILHGIGAGGDNANPTANNLSNKNPLHPTRSTEVLVYNDANQLVASGSSNVTYASTSGHFTGKIPLNTSIKPGKYTVKVGTNRYLKRFIKNIQTLTGEENQILPSLELIAGDIDNNNKIDILDYNTLLDCYSDLVNASASCSTQKKEAADINDDGLVNQSDYNLFLREILTQPGA